MWCERRTRKRDSKRNQMSVTDSNEMIDSGKQKGSEGGEKEKKKLKYAYYDDCYYLGQARHQMNKKRKHESRERKKDEIILHQYVV